MMLIVECERCSENMFISAGHPSVCKKCRKSETDTLGGYL
jgi:hypothetical protein